MVDPEVALDKLDSLGSADAIAEFLYEEGIMGTHGATRCPIANYLSRETGTQDVAVCSERHVVENKGAYNPPNVAKFVRIFDSYASPAIYKRLEGTP